MSNGIERDDDKSGTSNFFKRIRQGVTDISRPVHNSSRYRNSRLANNPIKDKNINATNLIDTNSPKVEKKSYKILQFEQLLNSEHIDLISLRKLSWNGVPSQFRPMVWQLLLGYMPTNKFIRKTIILRKRNEYYTVLTPSYFTVKDCEKSSYEVDTQRQILKDLPRISPEIPFFQQVQIQKIMERILFIWAIRHPASGYVQGMDDLLTPIIYLLMSTYTNSIDDVFGMDVGNINFNNSMNKNVNSDHSKEVSLNDSFSDVTKSQNGSHSLPVILYNVEADSYWCFTKLLDTIHDHYTFSQPGIQRMLLRLQDLTHRLDNELHDYFELHGLEYMQFGFRWMNCLLLRELPLRCILRLWDTYLSENTDSYESFHVYICTVLLKTFKEQLINLPNHENMLLFLQELPTRDWKEEEIEPILSQAFILSSLFENSPSHLN